MVWGLVYRPGVTDTDREALKSGDLEAAYLGFALKNPFELVDIQHDFRPCGAKVVEMYRARVDDPGVGIQKEDWVLGVWLPDEVFARVESGELNGFSWGTRRPVLRKSERLPVAAPVRGVGETEECEGHVHGCEVRFAPGGKVLPSWTGPATYPGGIKSGVPVPESPRSSSPAALEHRHLITRTTATGRTGGHAHRLFFSDTNAAGKSEAGAVLKFNPYHGPDGRFVDAAGNVTGVGTDSHKEPVGGSGRRRLEAWARDRGWTPEHGKIGDWHKGLAAILPRA